MAKRTETITLEGVNYTIHPFNIGELDQLAEIMNGPPSRVTFGVLRLALARAEPPITDIDNIEPGPNEVASAIDKIIALAGLKQPGANPPAAPGAT